MISLLDESHVPTGALELSRSEVAALQEQVEAARVNGAAVVRYLLAAERQLDLVAQWESVPEAARVEVAVLARSALNAAQAAAVAMFRVHLVVSERRLD